MTKKVKFESLDRLLLYNKGPVYVFPQELDLPLEERSLEDSILLYTSTGIHLFFETDSLFTKTGSVQIKDLKLPYTFVRYNVQPPPPKRSLYILGFLIGRYLFKSKKQDTFNRKELKLQFDPLEKQVAKLFLLYYDIPNSHVNENGNMLEIRATKESNLRKDVDRLLDNLLPEDVTLGDYTDAHDLLAGLYEANIYEQRKVLKEQTNPAIMTQLLSSLLQRDTYCRIEFDGVGMNRLMFTNSISRNLPLVTKFAQYNQVPYMGTPVRVPMYGVKVLKKLHFKSNKTVTVPLGITYQLGIKVSR